MIQDPIKFAASHWNWDFLAEAGCFKEAGPKFKAADIDGLIADEHGVVTREGIIHRANQTASIRRWHGHWLLFETKADRAQIKRAQEWNYSDLVRVGFTIIFIWGEPNAPTSLQVWKEGRPEKEPLEEPVTQLHICRWVRRWFLWASKTPSIVDTLEERLRLAEKQIEIMRQGQEITKRTDWLDDE
jgi:hypothetical protein